MVVCVCVCVCVCEYERKRMCGWDMLGSCSGLQRSVQISASSPLPHTISRATPRPPNVRLPLTKSNHSPDCSPPRSHHPYTTASTAPLSCYTHHFACFRRWQRFSFDPLSTTPSRTRPASRTFCTHAPLRARFAHTPRSLSLASPTLTLHSPPPRPACSPPTPLQYFRK